MRAGTSDTAASARRTASALPTRPRGSTFVVALVALVAYLVLAASAFAAPSTTVSLTFDDGRPSQMAAASQLADRGMTATFYIISSQVGLPGVMSLTDLNTLESEGMEIGAHSVSHPNLVTLTSDEAMRQLCLSRNWLMDRGFDIYDMAYPYDSTNTSVEQNVAACGYDSARSGGQLQCDSGHACSETTPPLDPYALRTPNDFNSSTTLAQMKAAVTNAESHGGGWVPLELHDVCDGATDPLLPAGAPCTQPDVITRALYTQFIDWLQGEVTAGRVQVKTVHDVIGGALKPQTSVTPAPVRTGNLILNASFETAGTSGAPASCFGNVNNGPDTPPTITTTSDAHDGTKALAISVPAAYDSWAYNLIAPTLDLAQCAPTAIANHRYTFTGWYKGNGQIRAVAYWRNADYQWARLDWGSPGTATFAAASSWTKGTLTFKAPAGATAVSAGFYIDGASAGHSYTIDDTSLIDLDATAPVTWALAAAVAGTGTGTVTSSPAGIACSGSCSASYTDGTSVTLTAAAAGGSSFTGWSGACTGTSTCTVTMTAARAVTATFSLLPQQLTVAKAGTGSGSVASSPAAIDCGATCQSSFTNGTSVTLTAVAAAGSSFAGWSGACTGTSTCTVTMTAARAVTATFTLLPQQLTVAKAGTGSGSVASSPAAIDCGATCQSSFINGTTVTLTAVAAAGSSFAGWSGACTGASTCTATMTAARAVTATFTLLPQQLTVNTAGTGSGSVASSPAGIDCGATCQSSFTNGTSVTLTAVAAAGSSFAGWGGACTGTSTCTVTMTAARAVTATFTLLPVPLSVTKAGTGAGTVTSSPAGIACGTTCQADFTNGASVTLTAVAAAGSSFTGWSGACSGTSTCILSLATAKAATATFTLLPVQLTVARSGTGAGAVTSSPAGIDCGATCQFSFVNGASVTLTAVPAAGSSFTGWSGACSGAATTCTVSMSTARSVTVAFTLLPSHLVVATTGSGSGSVSSSPVGIACGATCSADFTSGASVTLTAAPAAGSTFTGWTGACSGTATTCTLAMTDDRSASAIFTVKALLTVVRSGTGSGTVTSSPAGIACGATCSASFTNGASVTLTAAAAAGSTFTGWTGACTGTATTCTLAMTDDRSATAIFTVKALLTVVRSGTGNGTVTSSPAGIACGATCTQSLTNGTPVTLTAAPAAGSTFTGWTGACSGTTATCTLAMTDDRSATAIFTVNAALTVVKAGAGSGSVMSSPAGIACGTTCTQSFANGTSVTLTAVAAPGASFAGWSGDCSGLTATCTLAMTADHSATATFTTDMTLQVAVAGSGDGAVSGGGIDCGVTCQSRLTNGTTVTLTAVADPGSTFMGWSGACTGTATTCTVTMTEARSVTATFTVDPMLTVLKAGTGSGAVTADAAGIACAAACGEQHAIYTPGTTITLTAVATAGSTFAGWSDGSCTAPATCTFTLDVARTVTALFTLDPPPAALPVDPAPATPVAITDPTPVATAPVVTAPVVIPVTARAAVTRPVLHARPKVGGTPRAGRILVCSRGTWNGSPTRYAFTWRRDGKVVGHGASHVLRAADRGHLIRCDVTAGNAKGSATVASASVRVAR